MTFSSEHQEALEALTKTTQPENQLRAIEDMRTNIETEYYTRLCEAAPESLSHFVEYMTPDEPPAQHHEYMCEILEAVERREKKRVAFSCPPGHAKAVYVLTPVYTESGWKTIEEIDVGDRIYGTSGQLHNVLAKSELFEDKKCFKGITSDGEEIICSADHLWTLRKRRGHPFETMTTEDFFVWRENQKDKRAFLLPEMEPMRFEEKAQLIDPYVLGAWLGDGTSKSGNFTVDDKDRLHLKTQLERAGHEVTESTGINIYAKGLMTLLKQEGLLANKHIPDAYLYGSVDQRLALLQGLMDTDGNCRDNGGCRFVNTNEALIDQFRQLLWSLGVPNTKKEVNPTGIDYHKDGYTRSKCWVVSFSGIDCFRLPRKRKRLQVHKGQYGRYITFEPCETVPTRCIAVDSSDELFLVGRSFVPTHNTKFFSRFFSAWYLGKNPRHKFLQGGHSQNFVENELGKPTRAIIEDARYQTVFPAIELNPTWKAAGNWHLNNNRGQYVCKGVGQSIAGFRGNIGIIDDPFGSREDANSALMQKKASDWLISDFRARLLPQSPIAIVATRWAKGDMIGFVEQLSNDKRGIPWEIHNLNAIIETEAEMEVDPLGRSIGEVLWPDYYTVEEIMEIKDITPTMDWWALYKGKPRLEEGNVVKGAWFQRYDLLPSNGPGPDGNIERRVRRITVSVDCANKATQRANPSAITVWIEDMHKRHYLAEVIVEKLEYNELERKINDTARRWGANTIIVEDAGNGTNYLQQNRGLAPAPLVAIPTGNKSKEWRFDDILPMIEGGEVFLPKGTSWLKHYEDELLAFPFAPNDDQVDSTSQYLKWARGGAVQYGTRRLPGTTQSGRNKAREALLNTAV